MFEYSPPDNLNPITNLNEYSVADEYLTLTTAYGRYLKLTGGVVGELTTLNAWLNSAGIVNISNTTQSTTPTNGALVVSVSLGVAHNTHFGGNVHEPVGSAGAPTFYFISNPNTGIFQNGSNVVSITANGILSATISDTGLTSINPITLPTGSVSTCAIYFNEDTNTGLISGGSFQLT